jgi:hypothetical protein
VENFYRIKRIRLFEREPGEMNAGVVNRRFLQWLDSRPDRPCFAFLNYMEMHPPLDPGPEFVARFRQNRTGSVGHESDEERTRDRYDGSSAP